MGRRQLEAEERILQQASLLKELAIAKEEQRKAKEEERKAIAQCSAAERERDALRARAARAEEALREQHKRGISSQRSEHIAKRVRMENDPRLQKYRGTLCEKINQARDTGEI